MVAWFDWLMYRITSLTVRHLSSLAKYLNSRLFTGTPDPGKQTKCKKEAPAGKRAFDLEDDDASEVLSRAE